MSLKIINNLEGDVSECLVIIGCDTGYFTLRENNNPLCSTEFADKIQGLAIPGLKTIMEEYKIEDIFEEYNIRGICYNSTSNSVGIAIGLEDLIYVGQHLDMVEAIHKHMAEVRDNYAKENSIELKYFNNEYNEANVILASPDW